MYRIFRNGSGTIHNISASSLFITLACISFFLFTKSKYKKGDPEFTPAKRKRNIVYRACGIIMFACIGLAVLFLNTHIWEDNRPVFWSETIDLRAFGISWLTKGERILQH